MSNLVAYFSSPETVVAVAIPGLVSLAWIVRAAVRKEADTALIKVWMCCVIAGYFLSSWRVTDDLRQLFIAPVFVIYLVVALQAGRRVEPLAAFALTFLYYWTVDMARALELPAMGEVPLDQFYMGVGGAGFYDALLFFPLVAAAMVHYAAWRLPRMLPVRKGARPRRDKVAAAKITLAQWTKPVFGCKTVARVLRKQGFSLELALRVLTGPATSLR